VKIGDLIRHTRSGRIALILNIFERNHKTYAKLLFSGEASVTQAPFKILKDRWEILNESG